MVKLLAIYMKQDDPTKNTIVKLAKHHLVKLVNNHRSCPKKAIILDPFAEKLISLEDNEVIQNHGLIVVDCSWAQTDLAFTQTTRTGRKLPPLLAANNVNYGKWGKLSSAEALAATLYLIGNEEEARNLLSKFSWGSEFWKINQSNFMKYKK